MKENITIKLEENINVKPSVKAFYKMGLAALQVLDKAQAQALPTREVRKECQMI